MKKERIIQQTFGSLKLLLYSIGKNLVLLRQGVEQNEQTTVSHRISNGASPVCLLSMTIM